MSGVSRTAFVKTKIVLSPPVFAPGIVCVCGETRLHHPQRSVPLGRPLQAGGADGGLSGLAAALGWWRWGLSVKSPTDTCVPLKCYIKLLSSLSGYMLLAGRVRKPEEEAIILSILKKHFKRTVNPENLFSQKQVTSQFSKCQHFFNFYSTLDYLHFLHLDLHVGHSHCQWPVTVLYFTGTKSHLRKSLFDFALLSQTIEHKTLKVSFLQLLCSPFEWTNLKCFLGQEEVDPVDWQ